MNDNKQEKDLISISETVPTEVVKVKLPEVNLRIIDKFNKYDRGIKINNINKYYKFEELLVLPMKVLHARLLELNHIINNSEPGVSPTICFILTDVQNNKIVEFSWIDVKDL